MDKRTFIGWFEVGEPLIQQAMLQRVSDYQLRVIAKTRDKNLPHLPPLNRQPARLRQTEVKVRVLIADDGSCLGMGVC